MSFLAIYNYVFNKIILFFIKNFKERHVVQCYHTNSSTHAMFYLTSVNFGSVPAVIGAAYTVRVTSGISVIW